MSSPARLRGRLSPAHGRAQPAYHRAQPAYDRAQPARDPRLRPLARLPTRRAQPPHGVLPLRGSHKEGPCPARTLPRLGRTPKRRRRAPRRSNRDAVRSYLCAPPIRSVGTSSPSAMRLWLPARGCLPRAPRERLRERVRLTHRRGGERRPRGRRRPGLGLRRAGQHQLAPDRDRMRSDRCPQPFDLHRKRSGRRLKLSDRHRRPLAHRPRRPRWGGLRMLCPSADSGGRYLTQLSLSGSPMRGRFRCAFGVLSINLHLAALQRKAAHSQQGFDDGPQIASRSPWELVAGRDPPPVAF